MKFTIQTVMQGLMLTAPIVISSTIAVAPSQAASFATASGSLLLENFTWQGNNLGSDIKTFTKEISSSGSKTFATATAKALATPDALAQFSKALALGNGSNYFATAKSSSFTEINFDTQCGCFQFDFSAALAAIAFATEPGEYASANSLVAFGIFNGENLIDSFEASLSANNPFNLVRSSDFIHIDSIFDSGFGVEIAGFYQRHFEPETQLTVRGITRTDATATVPEPPMFAALVILPGLFWLKRRSQMKALPQAISDRQSD
ncbi:MAG: hypothetical protein J0L70_11430 [Leptolyngbya sp. UWPOB_LEPTO1]|uniref:hypothetical protein n=1 Tax=Leptolyngbya sp. UWPOB_LEPTO1 TaxID=2815653 RepID=UPI001AD209D7|nr:hypothetical protein [Leptolyngbya sp. UWPOB_LEPTO1]MBN8561128.1 hypothetical protein [Leptolyngbya sp. UWPOB_LEPTO1]